MEMMTNGRRIDTRSEPSPARPMFLSFTRRARTMGRPPGLLRPRRTQRMALGEVLSHDLVDLRLAVRLETHIDALQKSVALHDDIETPGLLRVAEDLFEIADRGLKCRAPIDCHQSIARLEVGAIRRAVGNYRLDGQSRIQLHELHAQVTAAGKHLTDVLLAVAGGRRALLCFVGRERGGESNRCGDGDYGKSNAHC